MFNKLAGDKSRAAIAWFAFRAANIRCVALASIYLLLGGCSHEPRQYELKGAVRFQGQPVADGQIVFEDQDQTGNKWPARIENGQYQLKLTPGQKLVRISASKPTGRMLPGGMGASIPEQIELVPARYNTSSQEQCTVEPRESQTLDFDLQ